MTSMVDRPCLGEGKQLAPLSLLGGGKFCHIQYIQYILSMFVRLELGSTRCGYHSWRNLPMINLVSKFIHLYT